MFFCEIPKEKSYGAIWCLRVYQVRDGLPGPELWLIIRWDDNGEAKYQFSNASPNTAKKKLAEMSCSRYWIERAFEDAKWWNRDGRL